MAADPFVSLAMLAQRAPGLYVDWHMRANAANTVRPSGVPAIVGLTRRGGSARGHATVLRFDRWQRFQNMRDALKPSAFLFHAVCGFFQNGGERCVVVALDADSEVVDRKTADANPAAAALAAVLTAPFRPGGILESIEDIDLVCLPDAMQPCMVGDPALVAALHGEAVDHCDRLGDRFAILDVLPSVDDANGDANPGAIVPAADRQERLRRIIAQWQRLNAAHGALYYPWVRVKAWDLDARRGATTLVPPCGHVAGVYARSDSRVGVHKAPANEPLEGVLDLAARVTDSEQAELNAIGVNCLRERPGYGLLVWGARTLSDGSDLRYVNVVRVLAALRRELEHELADFAFEPIVPALWDAMGDRLRVRFRALHRAGVLKGHTASDAYFVKCDSETNPVEAREAGRVMAEAGLAIASPAEFVVVRITQTAHGVTVSGPIDGSFRGSGGPQAQR